MDFCTGDRHVGIALGKRHVSFLCEAIHASGTQPIARISATAPASWIEFGYLISMATRPWCGKVGGDCKISTTSIVLKKIQSFNMFKPLIYNRFKLWNYDVTKSLSAQSTSSEVPMSKPDHTAKTVPQHVFERHESEWRQMQTRETAPKPATHTAQA